MTERQRFAGIGAVLLGSVLSLWLPTGCGKKAPPKPSPAPTPAPAKPAATAVLIGSVRLAPGHELPSYSQDQMERSVLAHIKGGTFPKVCTPPKIKDRQPVELSADGKLIGVMVAASEFSQRPPKHTPRVFEATIKDCRLTPSLIVAEVGDTLHIKNDVEFPFLPGMGSDTFNQTLSQGQSRDVLLETGGVKILTCGFTAPCGRTDVIVVAHPYAAVTDSSGQFRIDDFPADETVRLNAWHPLFSETFISVRVARGETKTVELELTPLPPPAPAPPEDKTKPKPMEPD